MKAFLFSSMVALVFLSACSSNGPKQITETGTLEATEVTVSAQVNGPILTFVPEEGSAVKAGDTLATIDPTEWDFQRQQAEANFRAVDAQYKLTLEGARREDVTQAEASYQSAKIDLRRMEELFKTQSIPQKQLDDARTRFTLAQQTLGKMKRGSRQAEVELAKARRDQAEAQLGQLVKKAADCTITAPLAGTVINRFVEPGELVGPGSAVARIADLSKLEVNIYVAETVLPQLRLGQEAQVQVDAFDNRRFTGTVVFISPMAEFTPKNIQTKDERIKLVFAVKLNVPNPDGALKAGLPADVTLRLHGE
jgi:membrane fusion protein YbhG